ncbi:globin family protein [Rubrivivax albus]|uniref:Hemin receptor n=1 Tax=Rubrivivax albus TaxID=2499835 RepID=A0A437K0H8_9BURK|nr:globin family protein [Rubrivivax albus]RVT53784.1 hemin receptor [Rubrivivax albus]
MHPNTIQRVQASWARVQPMADAAGALFYRNLFAADPALQPLFRGDMAVQARRLVQMIDVAVRGLGDLPVLLPALRALGQRHEGYGVQARHYDTVGAALLATLAQGLGEDFTPEDRDAWAEVYGALAAAMQAQPVELA